MHRLLPASPWGLCTQLGNTPARSSCFERELARRAAAGADPRAVIPSARCTPRLPRLRYIYGKVFSKIESHRARSVKEREREGSRELHRANPIRYIREISSLCERFRQTAAELPGTGSEGSFPEMSSLAGFPPCFVLPRPFRPRSRSGVADVVARIRRVTGVGRGMTVGLLPGLADGRT